MIGSNTWPFTWRSGHGSLIRCKHQLNLASWNAVQYRSSDLMSHHQFLRDTHSNLTEQLSYLQQLLSHTQICTLAGRGAAQHSPNALPITAQATASSLSIPFNDDMYQWSSVFACILARPRCVVALLLLLLTRSIYGGRYTPQILYWKPAAHLSS